MKRLILGFVAALTLGVVTFGVMSLGGSGRQAAAHISPNPCSSETGPTPRIRFVDEFGVPINPAEPVKDGTRLRYEFGVTNPAPVIGLSCGAFNVHVYGKLPGQLLFHEICVVAVDNPPFDDNLPQPPLGNGSTVFCPRTGTLGFDDYIVSGGDKSAGTVTASINVKGNRHNQTNNCIDTTLTNPEVASSPQCFQGVTSGPIGYHHPDVSVVKVGKAKVLEGANAVFNITVTAGGQGDSFGVTLSDQLAKGGTASGDCVGTVAAGEKLTCNFGTMSPDPAAPNHTRHVTVNVPTTHANCLAGAVTNIASVTADQDDEPGNNTSETASVLVNCETPTPEGNPAITKSPRLANLWLCNIDAPTCSNKSAGVEEVNFNLDLLGPVNSLDPKCYGFPNFLPREECDRQTIGAFEFELRYDSKLINVDVIAGSLWRDSDGDLLGDARCTTIPTQNAVQFRCNVKGKNLVLNGPGTLAVVHVRATADDYSILIPSQLNGIVTQLINQDCNLADLQGHPIKLAGQSIPDGQTIPVGEAVCDDADVTIRYLEGDLHADCVIDIHDQQQIAFRWGSHLGQLIYNSRFDIEPSSPKLGDGDIDGKDIQTVFGRHDSTCKAPHPEQPPIDLKSKEGEPPLPTPTPLIIG